MEKDKAMLPTNDYIFKRIFGHKGNEEITKGLVSAIIGQKIKTVEIDESVILEKDLRDDKVGILDIKANLDDDKVCNIEMQVTNQHDIEKRIMYYWSKIYSSEINSGEDYLSLPKTIAILIADFEVDNLHKLSKFHTKWNIREEEFSKIILTDVLEIHIIELPKLNNNALGKDDKVALWSKFIIDPDLLGEKDMSENEDIKKAQEEYSKIEQDKHERYLAHLRMKHILDSKSIERYGFMKGEEKGRKEGEQIGLKKGREEGLKQGELNAKTHLILKLHQKHTPLPDIAELTELSEKEVKAILEKEGVRL